MNKNIRPFSLKLSIPWLAIAMLSFGIVGGAPPARPAEHAPDRYTFDSSPVFVRLNGVGFQIPRNYFTPPAPIHETVLPDSLPLVTLETMPPDLKPISPENVECFTHQDVCDRIVWISIEAGYYPPIAKQADGFFVDPKTIPGPYGLRQFTGSDVYTGFYTAKLDGGQTYIVVCNMEGMFPHLANCRYEEPLTAKVHLYYIFHRTRLAAWRDIHAKVLALVASFRKD